MIRSLPFFLLCLLLTGCAGSISGPVAWQDEAVNLVWPEPPDQPRVRYLRSLSGPEDFKETARASGALSWLLGERQEEPSLVGPFAVASSRSGTVWVADNVAQMLYRFDMNRRKVDYFLNFSGLSLVSPSGLAVDDERQRVFMADAGHSQVLVLDSAGKYLESWAPPGGFKRPAGMALAHDGRLLVADAGAGVVYVFNR